MRTIQEIRTNLSEWQDIHPAWAYPIAAEELAAILTELETLRAMKRAAEIAAERYDNW